MSLTALGPEQIAQRLYRSQRIHRAIASPEALTDNDIRAYHETGFLAIENVFAPEEVRQYTEASLHLIGGGNPEFKGIQFEEGFDVSGLSAPEREPYVRKLMWFVEFHPALKAMSVHAKLHAIMERLVGTKLNLIQDMALLKPPHVGREKPWHQDAAYFAWKPPDKIIGTWTALDPATPENGCMHVIPGSHRQGPRPHYHDRDCQLPDEDVNVEQDVVVPLSPGGVLLFSALLHHGTPPNRSSARRRAIQLHYASTDCLKIDGDEHEQLFHDAAGYAGCAGYRFGKPKRPIVSKPEQI